MRASDTTPVAANWSKRPQNGSLMRDSELQKIVLNCLTANYGLTGRLVRLPGENLNFLLVADDGTKHVFKIVDEHMPPDVVEMEFAAIEHAVKAGFRLQLPRIKENKYGNLETGIKLHKNAEYRLRKIEFLAGTELSSISDISEKLLSDLGKTLATFNLAMRGFEHPAAHRSHRWNLAEAERHEDKMSLIADPENRQLLEWAYSHWRACKERLGTLPWQFIHGDAHDENVMVENGRVSGLIDFGDCCFNPTVCDLAICLTYLMMRGEDALRNARIIIDGYREVRPLSLAECSMLYPLVCARLAVSVCVANRRKTIDPGNPNWFAGEAATWALLARLRDMGPEKFERALVFA
jgi:Ser/Thr protein kinase RdoA (MazF antagonist)